MNTNPRPEILAVLRRIFDTRELDLFDDQQELTPLERHLKKDIPRIVDIVQCLNTQKPMPDFSTYQSLPTSNEAITYAAIWQSFGYFHERWLASCSDFRRKEKSQQVLAHFSGPDDKKMGNYLLTDLWLPWAKEAVFVDALDHEMIGSRIGGKGKDIRHEQSRTCWALPNWSTLQYMVANAIGGKITEIGAGRGYWAKLLAKAGAHVQAVEPGLSDEVCGPPLIKKNHQS